MYTISQKMRRRGFACPMVGAIASLFLLGASALGLCLRRQASAATYLPNGLVVGHRVISHLPGGK